MKILITADLHYREEWFRWLSTRAGDYDLICIAGDLLDMFFREPRIVQAFIEADAQIPKEVSLPRPIDREVAKILAERRDFPRFFRAERSR